MKDLSIHITEKLHLGKHTELHKTFVPRTTNEFTEYYEAQREMVKNSDKTYGSLAHPVDLSNIDFSELLDNDRDITYLLDSEYDLKYVDASNWIFDSSIDTSIEHMFCDCDSLKSIDVSNWYFSNKIRGISGMFQGCESLEEIKGIEDWNVSNIHLIGSLFSLCPIKKLDLHKWKTVSIERARCVFKGCYNLEELDLTGWDLSNVKYCNRFFEGCFRLKQIKGIEDFDVSGCTSFANMFMNCTELDIDLNKWKVNPQAILDDMFYGCTSLKNKPSWYKE